MDVNIVKEVIGTVKKSIKHHHLSKNPLIKYGVSGMYSLLKAAKTAKRMCIDPNFRSIFLMQLLNSKNVHQTTSLTYMDRYPEIFSACRDYFFGRQDLRILSYGCSTGEEVLTLRRYFPNAEIIGAEINKNSLSICNSLPVDEKISFIYSSIQEIEKYGPFDAIFCMAVLQRKPHYIASKGITNLTKIYPFEKFELQIIELDKLVKPQGLLITHFSQYSLIDTVVASKYQALGNYQQNDYLSPVFDRNSILVKNPAPMNSIFMKLHS